MKKNFNFPNLTIFYYLILFGIICFCFFYGFSTFAIEDMNEGLYAEIAREMLVTHNYIIPHLNFVPYLEKPPLLYWLIAISYHLFGISAWAARLIPALAAAITCLACLQFAKAFHRAWAGWIAALLLATSVGMILIGRVVIFDMLLTAFFVSAMFCFYIWYQQQRIGFLWASYVLLGLGFMTKGLVVVALAGAIALVFMISVKTPWRKILAAINPVGICLFLLMIMPWVVMATLQQTGFAWDFFINEQVMRFLNKRIPHDYHTGPIYYYLPRILVYLFPWSILLLALFKSDPASTPETKKLKLFLWAAFLVPLLFYSLSEAKGDYYMILGIPFLGLLLGIRIEELLSAQGGRSCYFLFIGLAGLLLIAIMLIMSRNSVWLLLPHALVTYLGWIGAILLIYTVIGIGILCYWRSPLIALLLTAGLMLPVVAFYLFDKQVEEANRSQKATAEWLLKKHPDASVYLYQDYENISSFVYYLQKRVIIVDSQSQDLYFGSHTATAKNWFISMADLLQQANTKRLYVLLLRSKLPEFERAAKIQFCPVQATEKVLVVTQCK